MRTSCPGLIPVAAEHLLQFQRRLDLFHPYVAADRLYCDAMVAWDYEFWRKTTLQNIEEHGHQETLNWLLMLGAMAELGGRKPQGARFVESWLTNANTVFAVFRP
jgi:hypothetical protein